MESIEALDLAIAMLDARHRRTRDRRIWNCKSQADVDALCEKLRPMADALRTLRALREMLAENRP